MTPTTASTAPSAVVIPSTPSFHFRQAIESDVTKILGQAIRDSERAHTGKGIWDVAIGEDSDPHKSLSAVLGYACQHDETSHVYFPHFLVAVATSQPDEGCIAKNEEKEDGEVVAAGCGFLYPQFATRKSFPGLSHATRILRGTAEEDSVQMWTKVDFLESMFPDYDYDNTWMLDAIYVVQTHRKYGIALQMMTRLYEAGRSSGAKECLLVSAIGNIAAYRLYEKAGFECVGEGRNQVAEDNVGYAGFYLFRKPY